MGEVSARADGEGLCPYRVKIKFAISANQSLLLWEKGDREVVDEEMLCVKNTPPPPYEKRHLR